jgi:actin-like protein 6A
MVNEEKKAAQSSIRYINGRTELGRHREHMKLTPLFQEDGFMNFDVLEEILAVSLNGNLRLPVKETPLLFTEASIHNKELRLKLTEFLFERLQAPSIFLCKDSVLSSFACGRSTAIVLDSGLDFTTATPVHDGYALQKCILRNEIGGNFINAKLEKWLTQDKGLDIKPRYTFKRKFTNVDGVENFTTTPVEVANCDPVFHKYSQMQIVRDIKEDFLFVSEEPMQGLGAA